MHNLLTRKLGAPMQVQFILLIQFVIQRKEGTQTGIVKLATHLLLGKMSKPTILTTSKEPTIPTPIHTTLHG